MGEVPHWATRSFSRESRPSLETPHDLAHFNYCFYHVQAHRELPSHGSMGAREVIISQMLLLTAIVFMIWLTNTRRNPLVWIFISLDFAGGV